MADNRFVLAIRNDLTRPGPWCAVSNLLRLEVVDASQEDILSVEWYPSDRTQEPVVLMERHGPGVHEVCVPAGRVRVRRVSGSSKISVFGWG